MNSQRLKFRFFTIDSFYTAFIQNAMSDLSWYFITIEGLIVKEEKREVEKLEELLLKNPNISSGDFWEHHYPYQWEDVFASQLRLSFVIWAIATFEQKLKSTSRFFATELGENWEEPNQDILKSTRKFYKNIGFTRPDNKLWFKMGNNIKIRNFLAHHGLFVGEPDNKYARRILQIAKRENGIEIDSMSFITINPEYCKQIISTMRAFFKDLFAEAKEIETRKKK